MLTNRFSLSDLLRPNPISTPYPFPLPLPPPPFPLPLQNKGEGRGVEMGLGLIVVLPSGVSKDCGLSFGKNKLEFLEVQTGDTFRKGAVVQYSTPRPSDSEWSDSR